MDHIERQVADIIKPRSEENRTLMEIADALAEIDILIVEELKPIAAAIVRLSGATGRLPDGSKSAMLHGRRAAGIAFMFDRRISTSHERALHRTAFHRFLLDTCQHEFESLLNVLETVELRQEKQRALRRRLVGVVQLLGCLYLRRMLAHRVVADILFVLASSHSSLLEFRVSVSCSLLEMVGNDLALIDTDYVISFVDSIFEIAVASSFSRRTYQRIQRLKETAIHAWQAVLVLTMHVVRLPEVLCVTCTTIAGEEACSFEIPYSSNLPELESRIRNQIQKPHIQFKLVLPTGTLLPQDNEAHLVHLICD